MSATEFFGSAYGFFSSAIAGGLITAGLSIPTTCYKLIDGEWKECVGPSVSTCPGDLSPGPVDLTPAFRCENFIGLDAFADHQGTGTGVAFIAALICGGVAFGGGKAAQ